MKRFFFLLLPLLMLICTGCSGILATGAAYDTNGLMMIDNYLSRSDDILEDVQLLIASQTQETDADSEEAQLDYYSADVSAEVYTMAEQLSEYILEFEKMKANVDSLSLTEVEQVDKTINAARHYFDKTTTALKDLMGIFEFYFAFESAMAPVVEFDGDSYTDFSDLIENLYNAVETAKEGLGSIDCPPYMSPTFSRYIKHFGTYNTALESLYTVMSLQQYEVYDILRITSIDSLITRLNTQNEKYITLLSEDFNLQYEKVSLRLSGELQTLHNELTDNCSKLIAHAS